MLDCNGVDIFEGVVNCVHGYFESFFNDVHGWDVCCGASAGRNDHEGVHFPSKVFDVVNEGLVFIYFVFYCFW